MPQIDQIADIYASQLFWLVLVFGLLLIGSYVMLPKIQGTVEARDAKISGDLAAAETARAEADAADETYQIRLTQSRNEAQSAAAAAKHQATAAAEQRLKAADADMAAHLATAEQSLRSQQAAAVGEIEGVATQAVQEIVAKVAGLNIDTGSASSAVKAALGA